MGTIRPIARCRWGSSSASHPVRWRTRSWPHVELEDLCEPPEVAGPGFINLRLQDDWLIGQLARSAQDERLAIATVKRAAHVRD